LNDFNTLLPEYARYLFRDISFRREVYQLATGDIRFNISQESLANIEIEIPDLPTQKEIASILSSLDEKIELNLQMNQTLEAMAQAIFKEWFVNFNFPGFDGELVDGLPKGWNRCLIKDFGKIVCGKTPSKAVKEYFGGEYMFIKIPDMHNSVFIIETTDSLTEEGVNSQSNKTIPPFSICVSSIATVGLVCINPEPCQTNQQINSIIPKNKDLRYFLYFLTTSMKDTFLATASGGTATLNMNTSQFSNIRAFMPSEDVLNEFDEIVSPIMEKILENEYNIKSLTQTRDTLLPKLMSGQLEIS
jgi:type I restriction enzyme S subunit